MPNRISPEEESEQVLGESYRLEKGSFLVSKN